MYPYGRYYRGILIYLCLINTTASTQIGASFVLSASGESWRGKILYHIFLIFYNKYKRKKLHDIAMQVDKPALPIQFLFHEFFIRLCLISVKSNSYSIFFCLSNIFWDTFYCRAPYIYNRWLTTMFIGIGCSKKQKIVSV
jgi:hypothetical protein